MSRGSLLVLHPEESWNRLQGHKDVHCGTVWGVSTRGSLGIITGVRCAGPAEGFAASDQTHTATIKVSSGAECKATQKLSGCLYHKTVKELKVREQKNAVWDKGKEKVTLHLRNLKTWRLPVDQDHNQQWHVLTACTLDMAQSFPPSPLSQSHPEEYFSHIPGEGAPQCTGPTLLKLSRESGTRTVRKTLIARTKKKRIRDIR